MNSNYLTGPKFMKEKNNNLHKRRGYNQNQSMRVSKMSSADEEDSSA